MALKDEAAEQFLQDLISSGLAQERDRTDLEFDEKYEGRQFTAEILASSFMNEDTRYMLKQSQVDTFDQILESNGLPVEDYAAAPVAEEEDTPWYKNPMKVLGASTLGLNPLSAASFWTAIAKDDIKAALPDVDLSGTGSGYETGISKFNTAATKRLLQLLEARGVDYSSVEGSRSYEAGIYDSAAGPSPSSGSGLLQALNERDYAAVRELLHELDLSDAEISGLIDETMNAGQQAFLVHTKVIDDIDEVQEQEEVLLSSDDKLQGKKEFEILEKEYPGRYLYNEDNGRIYETGTGNLVDSHGEIVEPDYETGEWPEGVGAEEGLWNTAQMTVPPWEEYNIDPDTYYGLLDVVENPDQYHGEGLTRFTQGGNFLGGFDQGYGVVQDTATQSAQVVGRYGADAPGSNFADYLTPKIQEVRRPWYDPGDNWALYAGMSPEAAAAEQQKLVAMGALDANEVVDGVWGPAEAQAVEKMMVIANGRAERLEDIDPGFWSEYWKDVASSGAASRRGFVRPAYEKLDPARAQLTIEDTVRRMLGRDATQNELADLGVHMSDMHRQSFVADVGAMEAEYAAETRAIDTGDAQSAGEYQGVDWEAQFMTKFNDTHSAELDRYDRTQDVAQRQQLIGGALNGFMNQLGGGIGGGSMGGR